MLEIVKGNTARFAFYKCGELYYEIIVEGKPKWMFPVNVDDKKDIGSACFNAEHKAINLMRYIRKAMEGDTFVKVC